MYILSNHYILQESWRNIIFHLPQHWFTFQPKLLFLDKSTKGWLISILECWYDLCLIFLQACIGLLSAHCAVYKRLQKKWVEGFPRCTLTTTTNILDIILKIWPEWLASGALTHVYQNYRVSHLTGVPKIWDSKGQTFLRRPLLWCMLLWH